MCVRMRASQCVRACASARALALARARSTHLRTIDADRSLVVRGALRCHDDRWQCHALIADSRSLGGAWSRVRRDARRRKERREYAHTNACMRARMHARAHARAPGFLDARLSFVFYNDDLERQFELTDRSLSSSHVCAVITLIRFSFPSF